MKTLFFKIIFILNLFFIYNCKAQTTNDYITFYNDVAPKLNSIIPNKTQFYGQPFSNFYSELQNKNITVVMFGCVPKSSSEVKYYRLYLYFCDASMLSIASDNSFRYPWIVVTFENEIPPQIKDMIVQYHGVWNPIFEQFFSTMKIEKMQFIGVKGYNVKDWSE